MDVNEPEPPITIRPIAHVRSSRSDPPDDDWARESASIELVADLEPDALRGLEDFSHAEVIFQFHLVPESAVQTGVRRPRGNAAWPTVGIFAQRGKNRPNRLGATIVEIKGRKGRVLLVAGLDAVDGTPIIDIKPVMAEFLPRGLVRQPSWATELMMNYWRPG